MIRKAIQSDKESILLLSEQVGFGNEEKEYFGQQLDNAFQSISGKSIIVYEDNGVQAAAFLVEDELAPGVWNMLFIAVSEHQRNSGIGSQLIEYIEKELLSKKARLLIVETSSQEYFIPARKFYEKNNFTLTATIPNYYEVGDDKIIYYKSI